MPLYQHNRKINNNNNSNEITMDKSRAQNESSRKAYQLANIYTALNQYLLCQTC
jgi:hypothetical protein